MGKSAHWVFIAHFLLENEKKKKEFSVTKIAPPPAPRVRTVSHSGQGMRRLRPFAVSCLQSRVRCIHSLPSASPARAVTFKYLQHSGLSTAAPLSDLGLNSKRTQSAETGAKGKHLRVCVVGSGPAGFYVTKYLLKVSKV